MESRSTGIPDTPNNACQGITGLEADLERQLVLDAGFAIARGPSEILHLDERQCMCPRTENVDALGAPVVLLAILLDFPDAIEFSDTILLFRRLIVL